MTQLPRPFPEAYPPVPPQMPQPRPLREERWWLISILFLLTLLTTLYCGFQFHVGFVAENAAEYELWFDSLLANPLLLRYGAPFSFTLLLILIAHEMGHYLACRFYKIDATPPFIIPAPPFLPLPPPLSTLLGFPGISLNPFGTFGAVIRIRSLFPGRRSLFDVGIAGPLAGFAFILPALVLGLLLSKEFVAPPEVGLAFGEPALFQLAQTLFFSAPEGAALALHPIGWAAWFGMLATSLNLLPIGQLDGGHVVYAIFGPRVHRQVSHVAFIALILISLLSWPAMAYIFFALLIRFLGFKHPPTFNDYETVGKARIRIAILGWIILALTFIPVPIEIIGLD